MISVLWTLVCIVGMTCLIWLCWDSLFEDGVLRRGGKHARCLKRIEALERELFPHLFPIFKEIEFSDPAALWIEKYEWLEDLEYRPGAVWQVDSGDQVRNISRDIQRAYAEATRYEQQNKQRELVSLGLHSSAQAAQTRSHSRMWT